MTILQKVGVDWRDRKFIWNLYNKRVVHVRTGDRLPRQWCSLSRCTAVFNVWWSNG